MALSFAAAVANWAKNTEEKQTAILHAALRKLDSEIAERIPVVTGNLKNSRTVTTLGPPPLDFKTKKFRDPSDAINNAIAGVAVGQTAWFGFRAPYARKIEADTAFLRLPAQRWPQIVAEAVRAVKGGG